MAVHETTAASLNTNVSMWLPSNEKPTDAWTCGGTPVLWFGDVEISYETGWSGVDVRSKWAALAKGSGGTVETVLGRSAYVHAADERGPRDCVLFVVSDVLVSVLARPGVPIERLIELANSIELPRELRQNS